jgi:LysM repeat protein
MSYKQRGLIVAAIVLAAGISLAGCTMSLSQAPQTTPTLIPTGLFVSPFPSVANPMEMIEEFAKQTAAAQTAAVSSGTPGTPQAVSVTGTIITPQTVTPTVTGTVPTPTNAIATTPVVAATTVTPGGPSATPIPPGVRPQTYTLQKNEFPYCIARRFNVDPEDLLALNGLSSGDVYYAGLALKIPQSGSWPGTRALRNHPDTYTVTGNADDNVYGVACKYGDVDPAAIASANGISVSASLSVGQQLKIP